VTAVRNVHTIQWQLFRLSNRAEMFPHVQRRLVH